jgi:hypothetical protein
VLLRVVCVIRNFGIENCEDYRILIQNIWHNTEIL